MSYVMLIVLVFPEFNKSRLEYKPLSVCSISQSNLLFRSVELEP